MTKSTTSYKIHRKTSNDEQVIAWNPLKGCQWGWKWFSTIANPGKNFSSEEEARKKLRYLRRKYKRGLYIVETIHTISHRRILK